MTRALKAGVATLVILLSLLPEPSGQNDFICRHSNIGDNPIVEIGDKLMLCSFFLPFMIKLRFNIEVDKAEILHGKDLWRFFDGRSVDVLAQVGNTRKFSQQTPYLRDNGNFAYPVLIFTIILHKGIIIDIRSEDMIDLCPDTYTEVKSIKLKSNINLPPAIKYKKKKGSYCHVKCSEDEVGLRGKCDPKILITWQGTDKNNSHLLSHYDSLNTYNSYNKHEAYQVIMNLFEQFETDQEYSEDKIPRDIKARLNKT